MQLPKIVIRRVRVLNEKQDIIMTVSISVPDRGIGLQSRKRALPNHVLTREDPRLGMTCDIGGPLARVLQGVWA